MGARCRPSCPRTKVDISLCHRAWVHFCDCGLPDRGTSEGGKGARRGRGDAVWDCGSGTEYGGPLDKTPWMRRTRWAKEFVGKDMTVVAKRSQKPTKDEQELHSVWQSVHRVLNQCVAGVTDCRERNWSLIPFWLNSSEATKADDRPFGTDKDKSMVQRYIGYWQQFMCYCLRSVKEGENQGGV